MISRHTFYYSFARGLPGLINLISISLFSRIALPEEYGVYVLVIAVAGLFNVFLFQWARFGLLRYYPLYQQHKHRFFSTIAISFIVTVIISGIFVAFILWFTAQEVRWLWIIGAGILWVQAWYDLNLEIIRSDLSPILYGLLSLGKAAFALLFGYIFLSMGLGGEGLLLGLGLGMMIPVLFVMKRYWSDIQFNMFDKELNKRLFTYGIPLTFTFAMTFIIHTSDRILLSLFRGIELAGKYAVAFDVTQQTLILIMYIVHLAGFPLIVKAFEEEGIEAAKRTIESYMIALLIVSIPTTIGLILINSNITHVLLGSEYREIAFVTIPLIALASFFQGMITYYLSLAYHLTQQTSKQIWSVLLGAVINILLNLIFIPLWDVVGAAFASLLSILVVYLFCWYLGKHLFPLTFPKKACCQILCASIAMSLCLLPLLSHHGLISLGIQMTWGGLVYTIGLWVMNVHHFRPMLLTQWHCLCQKVKKMKRSNS